MYVLQKTLHASAGNLLPLENQPKKEIRPQKKNSDLNKKGKVIKYELFCDWVIARPEICKIMGGIEEALFGVAGRRFRHVSYNPNPN